MQFAWRGKRETVGPGGLGCSHGLWQIGLCRSSNQKGKESRRVCCYPLEEQVQPHFPCLYNGVIALSLAMTEESAARSEVLPILPLALR